MLRICLIEVFYHSKIMHLPRAGAANVAVEAGGAVAPKDGTLAVVAGLAKPTPVKLDAVEGFWAAKLKPVAPA